jgi:WD40 repeat protein
MALRCIKAFSDPINQLSFPFSDSKTFVASSTHQIKIYDLDSLVKKGDFTARNDAKINLVKIIPHDDRVLVVLQNNIICILTNGALKLIRHFEPLKARQKYLQKSNQKMEKVNYSNEPADDGDDDDEADVDKLIKSVTRNYNNGIVMDVSFSEKGNLFCVSFMDDCMMICSTSMWEVRRVIKFPDFYIKQCVFVPSFSSEYKPDIMLTLTSIDELMLTSLKDLNSRMLINMNNSSGFHLSSNGKLLMNLQHSGDVLVYNFELCANKSVTIDVDRKQNEQLTNENGFDAKCTKLNSIQWNSELDKIQMKVISRTFLFTNYHKRRFFCLNVEQRLNNAGYWN